MTQFPDMLYGKPVMWDAPIKGREIEFDSSIVFGSLSDYVLLTIKSERGSLTLTFGELEQLYEKARKLLKR